MPSKLIGFPLLILASLGLFGFAVSVDFGDTTIDNFFDWIATGLWMMFAAWAFLTLFDSDQVDDE